MESPFLARAKSSSRAGSTASKARLSSPRTRLTRRAWIASMPGGVLPQRAVLGGDEQVPVEAHQPVDAVAARHQADGEGAVLLVLRHLDVGEPLRLERRGEPTHPRLVLQGGLAGEPVQQRQLERLLGVAAAHQPLEVVAEALHLLEEVRQAGAGERVRRLAVAVSFQGDLPAALDAVDEEGLVLAVVLEVARLLPLAHLVQRRLGDEEVVLLDHLAHLAEEEGEDQGADVASRRRRRRT